MSEQSSSSSSQEKTNKQLFCTTEKLPIDVLIKDYLSDDLKKEMEYLFGKLPNKSIIEQHKKVLDDVKDKKNLIDEFKSKTKVWREEKVNDTDSGEQVEWHGATPMVLLEKDPLEEDLTYYRYLRGYNWNTEGEAVESMKKTINWRGTDKPTDLSLEDVHNIQKHGLVYHYGFDKEGHPVVYVDLSRNVEPDTVENQFLKLKSFIYMMQAAVTRAYPCIFELTWIIDVEKASFSMNSVKALKDVFMNLGDYYAERLTRVLILNPGWVVSLVYKFLKPFLPSHVAAKYHLMKGDVGKICREYIDKDQLLERYGGKAKYEFDYDRLLKFEKNFRKELSDKNITVLPK